MEDVVVLDLRTALDANAVSEALPGALRFAAEDIERRMGERPRDRAVLYMTERGDERPGGAQLRRLGVARVRPLLGGLESWRERGFPVEPLRVAPHRPGPVPVGAGREEAMSEAPRISVQEARAKVTSKRALLVCGYEDEEKCNKIKLDGAMSFGRLQAALPSLTRDQEIIFYCA